MNPDDFPHGEHFVPEGEHALYDPTTDHPALPHNNWLRMKQIDPTADTIVDLRVDP